LAVVGIVAALRRLEDFAADRAVQQAAADMPVQDLL
jgi:hypothetical protein